MPRTYRKRTFRAASVPTGHPQSRPNAPSCKRRSASSARIERPPIEDAFDEHAKHIEREQIHINIYIKKMIADMWRGHQGTLFCEFQSLNTLFLMGKWSKSTHTASTNLMRNIDFFMTISCYACCSSEKFVRYDETIARWIWQHISKHTIIMILYVFFFCIFISSLLSVFNSMQCHNFKTVTDLTV